MSNQPGAILSARAPTRIDFGGGWSDVPPYCDERGGCVCSVAITRYVTATLRPRSSMVSGTDEGALARAALRRAGSTAVALTLHTDVPVGAGLGGSSAAGVAALGVLALSRGARIAPEVLAEESRALEVDELGIAGGRQDHYAAAFGGALGLRFGGAVQVERLPLTPEIVSAIETRCIIIYSGESRISGGTITAVLGAFVDGDARVTQALDRMATLASAMIPVLREGDLDALAALVDEHWTHQRSLHSSITTPRIEEILARARDAGALGAKALGASGGGCVLVIAPADGEDRVRTALAPLGPLLPFRVDTDGFRVLDSDPHPEGRRS